MKKSNKPCDLKSCFLCKRCLSDWLPALENHRQNFIFKKGEKIFEEGQAVKGFYFLFRGRVKVHKKWGHDKQLILHFAREGNIIGYRGLGNEKVYPVSATALEEVNACFVGTKFFETTLSVNHELTYQLLQFYANELRHAERRMGNLVHMDVKGRVAETILMLKNDFGQKPNGFINITLTKQDLASYAGTTYETFSRMISELEKEKIVRLSGKNIGIRSESRLRKLIA
ncbi:MAG TPA: Crp/Fnr family transcriptional regulator [Chitinophagaceae bacterium]|nr:Crp/Fnr family transcriptional regulator [Chitinophagaceae bacterium]